MPGETSLSRSLYARKCAQGCGRKRGSRCGAKRRRSESNRRIEVLQTSALPLGYGAGRNVNSQPALGSARLAAARGNHLTLVVAKMVAMKGHSEGRTLPDQRADRLEVPRHP